MKKIYISYHPQKTFPKFHVAIVHLVQSSENCFILYQVNEVEEKAQLQEIHIPGKTWIQFGIQDHMWLKEFEIIDIS